MVKLKKHLHTLVFLRNTYGFGQDRTGHDSFASVSLGGFFITVGLLVLTINQYYRYHFNPSLRALWRLRYPLSESRIRQWKSWGRKRLQIGGRVLQRQSKIDYPQEQSIIILLKMHHIVLYKQYIRKWKPNFTCVNQCTVDYKNTITMACRIWNQRPKVFHIHEKIIKFIATH